MVNKGGYRRFHDGINSMCYEQLTLTLLDQYTLVYVRVNKTQVLQVKIDYDHTLSRLVNVRDSPL